MKLKSAFLIPLLSLSLNIALSRDEQGDNREVEAAVAVLGAKNDIEINHQYCRAKAGSFGYKYDYIEYVWQLRNRAYIQLSEKMFGALSAAQVTEVKQLWGNNRDKMLSDRKGMDNDGNGKYCVQYFSKLLDGTLHPLKLPRETLTPKLGLIDDVRILERNIDMEVGCIKQGYNSDFKQFAEIKKACNCQTSLVVRKMSNKEIDEYLALVSSKNPQEAVAFISKRINISELQACYEQVGPR